MEQKNEIIDNENNSSVEVNIRNVFWKSLIIFFISAFAGLMILISFWKMFNLLIGGVFSIETNYISVFIYPSLFLIVFLLSRFFKQRFKVEIKWFHKTIIIFIISFLYILFSFIQDEITDIFLIFFLFLLSYFIICKIASYSLFLYNKERSNIFRRTILSVFLLFLLFLFFPYIGTERWIQCHIVPINEGVTTYLFQYISEYFGRKDCEREEIKESSCIKECKEKGDFDCEVQCVEFDKPVIYLYPTKTQEVQVQLDYQGKLIADYPTYDYSIKGWEVIANPDGTLINQADKKEYSYLFWEGIPSDSINWDLSKGFVIKGEDTREFLQSVLSQIGLTPKEYNEFIVYWYPRMKDNKFNLIHFADEQYTKTAPLDIIPKPDSMLRVFMVFKPLNEKIEIQPQEIKSFERKGFTVVEWGGSEIE